MAPRNDERLDAIEARLAALEAGGTPAASAPAPETGSLQDAFWALEGLRARVPDPGGVMYMGHVVTPAGPVEWQFGATVDDLLSRDWPRESASLAALGNPVRLEILQLIVNGASSVSELVDAGELGSSGQVYHHINQLVTAGWLVPMTRGHFGVPPERVVPLLTILVAAAGVR